MASLPPLLTLFFITLTGVDAYNVFTPNCTVPTEAEDINFANGYSNRGTLDILWSCLSVLILCVWNIQHLAVPPHHELQERGKGLLADIRWNLGEFGKKVKWMLLMVVMPEYLFGKAVCEHTAAYYSLLHFNKAIASDSEVERGDRETLPWTMSHGYFANMRGFVLRFEAQSVPSDLKPIKGTEESKNAVHMVPEGVTSYSEQPAEETVERERRQWNEYCRTHGFKGARQQTPKTTKPDQDKEITPVGPLLDRMEESKWKKYREDRKKRHAESKGKKSKKAPKAKPAANETLLDEKKAVASTSLEVSSGDEEEEEESMSQEITSGRRVLTYPTFKGSWALSSHQMFHAYELGIIKVPTETPASEIQDRSKGDGMSKFITVMQITWLVVQIIARAIQKLEITLLEITVTAFATVAIGIYIVIWHKPQSVHTPVFVDACRPLTRQDVIELAARAPRASLFVKEFWLYGVVVRTIGENIFPYSPGIRIEAPAWLQKVMSIGRKGKKSLEGSSPNSEPPHMIINPILFGLGIGGAIFGTVHCSAWNFKFPTEIEQKLWQVSCLLIVLFPVFSAVTYWLRQRVAGETDGNDSDWTNKILYIAFPPIVLAYLLARLYLMVEVFRSLAYPQPSVFLGVDWAQFLPHLG